MIDEQWGDCLLEELQATAREGPGPTSMSGLGNPYLARTAVCVSHILEVLTPTGVFPRSNF